MSRDTARAGKQQKLGDKPGAGEEAGTLRTEINGPAGLRRGRAEAGTIQDISVDTEQRGRVGHSCVPGSNEYS